MYTERTSIEVFWYQFFILVKRNCDDEIKKIVLQSLENNELILKQALDEVDNPALTALSCSPDYLRSLSKGCLESLKYENDLIKSTNSYVIVKANEITHRIAVFIVQGRATGNNSPDINFGESKNFIFWKIF